MYPKAHARKDEASGTTTGHSVSASQHASVAKPATSQDRPLPRLEEPAAEQPLTFSEGLIRKRLWRFLTLRAPALRAGVQIAHAICRTEGFSSGPPTPQIMKSPLKRIPSLSKGLIRKRSWRFLTLRAPALRAGVQIARAICRTEGFSSGPPTPQIRRARLSGLF